MYTLTVQEKSECIRANEIFSVHYLRKSLWEIPELVKSRCTLPSDK